MERNSVHFFVRPEAPHLMSPKGHILEPPRALKNGATAIRSIDEVHSFRFLQLDGKPIQQSDKKYPLNKNSPLRFQREQVKLAELRYMQKHRGKPRIK